MHKLVSEPMTVPAPKTPIKMKGEKVDVFYGAKQALYEVGIDIPERQVTALIGPSGCGKSTFLRCLNRMNDTIEGARVVGKITLDGEDIYDKSLDVVELRARVGMVFQKPNPFPKSIYDNVAYGLRVRGLRNKGELDSRVEAALKGSALWSEVSDRLSEPGTALSGGQQQRLCIARALATEPEIILFDEPTSALDPIATASIEDLVGSFAGKVTVLIVTHNMQQAARVSKHTAFMYLGELVEYAETDELFTRPKQQRTSDYLTGRFG